MKTIKLTPKQKKEAKVMYRAKVDLEGALQVAMGHVGRADRRLWEYLWTIHPKATKLDNPAEGTWSIQVADCERTKTGDQPPLRNP